MAHRVTNARTPSGGDHKALGRMSGAWFEKFLIGAMLTLMMLAFHALWSEARVEAVRPAGRVLGIASGGGWGVQLLVETEDAFYPVHRQLAVERGTPLLLQVRGNGAQYLCDQSQTVCAKTSNARWGAGEPGGLTK